MRPQNLTNQETINLNIISSYAETFDKLYKIIKDNRTLTYEQKQQGLKLADEYYSYLIKCKEPYGEIALSVVRNEGFSGTVANTHLERQAIFNGVPKEQIEDLRTNIIIRLAHRDAELRKINTEVGYEKIADYHVEEFNKTEAGAYAWGGLLFEKVLGSGAWMSLHDSSAAKAAMGKIAKLENNNLLKNEVDGYSTYRMIYSFVDAVKCAPKYEFICPKEFKATDISLASDPVKAIAEKWNVEPNQVIKVESTILDKLIYFKVLPEYAIIGKTTTQSLQIEQKHSKLFLNPIITKIQQGLPLTGEEYSESLNLSQKHFFNNYHILKDEASKYNYEFVTGSGEVGALSNNMLKNYCSISSGTQAEQKCDYSKILLAANDLTLRQQKGFAAKLSIAEHDQIRTSALQGAGIDKNADIRNLTCALSGNKDANCSNISNIVEHIKPSFTFKMATTEGIMSVHLANSVLQTAENLKSAAIFKSALANLYGKGSEASISFIADSREQLANTLSVDPSYIRHKYNPENTSNDLRTSSSFTSKLFEVKPPLGSDAASTIVSSKPNNLSVISNPDFMLKLATSQISAINSNDSLASGNLSVKPVAPVSSTPPAVKPLHPDMLKINIGPDIHKRNINRYNATLRIA